MKNKENINLPPSLQTEIINDPFDNRINKLAISYATDFWAGSWKELLIEPTSGTQFGTYDQNGDIYQETQNILKQNNIEPNKNWPEIVWQKAGSRSIFIDGVPLKQFWTIESATNAIQKFVSPILDGGFGGKIITLKESDKIVGFTAYTVAEPSIGAKLVSQRFSYKNLDLESLINNQYPGQNVGIFLDFAISENNRGKGIGSKLFDIRLDQMVKDGAEVIIGRTIKSSPAQYYGNYIARGLEPIADDPTNCDKKIFAVKVSNIKSR